MIEYYQSQYDTELERCADLTGYFSDRQWSTQPFNQREREINREMVTKSINRQYRLLELIWLLYRAKREGIE